MSQGRIIPARAGFTSPTRASKSIFWDHPRSRGVYIPFTCWAACRSGSSPLARGLLGNAVLIIKRRRIIPARAGFTQCSIMKVRAYTDHPRSRGVYPRCSSIAFMAPGSSPLARGLLFTVNSYNDGGRIIPARAGFTRSRPGPECACKDHPRSRGVYAQIISEQSTFTGSSPLARGLLCILVPKEANLRIIPARAGFTTDFPTFALTNKDHPRSRGVYANIGVEAWAAAGSSPLARGLRR